ncbi:MAG TPA: ATPase [Bacteroidetes bacterium]|nr:ATPase [Bacteroidota bacterium]
MRRDMLSHLRQWKNAANRKPMIIRGARQVGKTWLMKEFGRLEYKNVAYINFESNAVLKDLFQTDFEINRILTALQIETGEGIKKGETLIIFDEIQEAPGALTCLKYFYENAPEYHIISAGSLLGVALNRPTSFPVGKVEFVDLFPLSYSEFLEATGDKNLLDLLESKDWELIKTFKNKFIEKLRHYYFVGGMPEAVQAYALRKDFAEIRHIQNQILIAYEQDFSKHAPVEITPRIRALWNSIPSQLAKENKKFIYGIVKQGARAKEYELALSWLLDSGLLHKVSQVNKPASPLKAYENLSAFKIFLLDVGLLGAMAQLDARILLDGHTVFMEFKGALTEQYVLQALLSSRNLAVYYWSAENQRAEVDFLIEMAGEPVPIEVKAEENLQAKSLKVYCQKYTPSTAIRTSMSDYREESWMSNWPLYAIHLLRS